LNRQARQGRKVFLCGLGGLGGSFLDHAESAIAHFFTNALQNPQLKKVMVK